jgi:hypothetical protein
MSSKGSLPNFLELIYLRLIGPNGRQ